MKVCIVGASGKLGRYMVQQALDRDYEVVGVCREESVGKLDAFEGRITVVPGATDDRAVIQRAVAGCDGVLVVLVPRGVHGYSTGTAQAVLDYAPPDARLVFSCGWHITRDGQDVYSRKLKAIVKFGGPLARLTRFADLDDQVEACRRVFASDTRWTVVRGSDLEEGESQGLPVWSRHVGDPVLESNITRRVDFALFMVEALENDALIHEAPAIVGRQTPSALAHAAGAFREFARRYTEAWCSQDPARVAENYAPDGSLTINDGSPSVGRAAITEAARSFMVAFPDMQVLMDDLVVRGENAEYRWTLVGTNTGPGGTGRRVRIGGFEEWTIGDNALIASSLGHYDQAEYDRQLEHGVELP